MQLFLCHYHRYGALSFTHFLSYVCLAFGFHFLLWANNLKFVQFGRPSCIFSVPHFPFWRYAHWFALKKSYFHRFLLNNISSAYEVLLRFISQCLLPQNAGQVRLWLLFYLWFQSCAHKLINGNIFSLSNFSL